MTSRRLDVDLVKAAGILAVVMIHCLRPYFDPQASPFELWFLGTLGFAVPGFFAASGLLYAASARNDRVATLARLRRILVPYLLASVAAQIYWYLGGRQPSVTNIVRDFLLGSSFGIYYYVFHAVLFILVTPLLARLGSRSLAAVTLAAFVAQLASWWVPLLRVLVFKNPLHWFAFFLAGWWLGRSGGLDASWPGRRMLVAPLAGAAALALSLHQPVGAGLWLAGLFGWGSVVCTLTMLFALGAGRETRSRLVRFLSDSTYTIYLFHLFFVFSAKRWLPSPAPYAVDPLMTVPVWLIGLAGPLALAVLGRMLLGARSRALLGS